MSQTDDTTNPAAEGDDVEGHLRGFVTDDGQPEDTDDVQGHRHSMATGEETDAGEADDVEGHRHSL